MMVTTPIKKTEDIDILKNYFLSKHEYRNYTLFVMGINTAMRISDLLQLTWNEVYDFGRSQYREHVCIVEQKTNKFSCIALNSNCLEALELLKYHICPKAETEFIFCADKNRMRPISRNRAYHIIKKAAADNHIEGNISCHSLRKTLGYQAWKAGNPPALIMNIYNHSNMEITKRYLAIDQDDRDALFRMINL